MSYQHIARDAVPLALADLHRSLSVGAPIEIQVSLGKEEAHRDDEHIGRRFFGDWQPESFGDVLVGAGFDVDTVEAREEHHAVLAKGCRARTLPDTVGTNMRVLVCGLNPSIYSADRGIGFARPGNRFWRAALDARMVTRDRDTRHALDHHRIGMTDLCKRATATSRELTREEYSAGAARVERLVAWLQPRIVLFVGLEGWRAAIDRNAQPGLQPHSFGGAPAYVMPSTSGLNARTSIADHTAHLRRVLELSQPKLRL
jgi:TDG/mug DNA glycosylase family protein